MKSFDKNKDGVVTEVKINYPCLFLPKFKVSDRHDDKGRVGLHCSRQRQQRIHIGERFQKTNQEAFRSRTKGFDGKGWLTSDVFKGSKQRGA